MIALSSDPISFFFSPPPSFSFHVPRHGLSSWSLDDSLTRGMPFATTLITWTRTSFFELVSKKKRTRPFRSSLFRLPFVLLFIFRIASKRVDAALTVVVSTFSFPKKKQSPSLSSWAMFSQHELHNPRVVLPRGPRTASQYAHTVNPLTSNRHGHVARLYSIVSHLLSLAPSPETSTRLVRAWRALAACKEVHVGVLWRTGTAVIERADGRDDDGDATGHAKADWLKFVQEGKLEKVDKFHEYILALVAAGQSQFGLDELESFAFFLSLPPSLHFPTRRHLK